MVGIALTGGRRDWPLDMFVFNMDKKALEPVYTLCSGIPSVYSLLFWNHLDQDILLCGTKTGAVYTWDLDNARITNKPQFEIGMSPCVSLSNSDDILVTQDKLGSVKLWQETPCSWTEIKSFHLDHTGFCRVDVSNLKDNFAALPRHKGGLEIYNLKSYEKVTSFNDSDTDIYEQLGELMACKLITISGITYVIAAYENEELSLVSLAVLDVCICRHPPPPVDQGRPKPSPLVGTCFQATQALDGSCPCQDSAVRLIQVCSTIPAIQVQLPQQGYETCQSNGTVCHHHALVLVNVVATPSSFHSWQDRICAHIVLLGQQSTILSHPPANGVPPHRVMVEKQPLSAGSTVGICLVCYPDLTPCILVAVLPLVQCLVTWTGISSVRPAAMPDATDVIIGFHNFIDDSKEFIVKELSAFSVCGTLLSNWMLKPPYAIKELPTAAKKQASYIVNKLHGNPWDSGGYGLQPARIPHLPCHNACRNCLGQGSRNEKFLAKYTPRPFVDLYDREWQELGNYKLVISKFFCITQPPQNISLTNHEISLRRMCGNRMVVISEKQDAELKQVTYLAPSWARLCEVWDLIDVAAD
uniref:Uncharacterized protein n=1 Tax=Timema genevievae TaxID=629358 RepID=A0A7R9K3M2_TIMGE|nr:unnamed protein product [Timema genevievae]